MSTSRSNRNFLVPATLKLSEDSVPNVRFIAAKTLRSVYDTGKASQDSLQKIASAVETLLDDSDQDVRHFAALNT